MRSGSVSSNTLSMDSIDLGKEAMLPIPNIKVSPPTPISASPTRSSQSVADVSVIIPPKYKDKIDENTENINSSYSKQDQCQILFKKWFRRRNLEIVFPILVWAPQYTKQKAIADLIAGVTVGLTVLPQGLAYATVAGLPPIYGLYSSFVGPFVYIVFGGTKAITIGPAAIQSILTYKYTEGRPPEYAVFLCFVTAVVTLFMGIFRLGFISSFISSPVISAFTSAVALTIIATQLKPLLGITFKDEGFLPTIYGLVDNIDEIKKHDAILSLTCCGFLIFMKYIQQIFCCLTKNFPRIDKVLWLLSVAKSAIVMLCSTLLVAHWYPDQPFSIVGHITPGLPAFKPPPFEIFDPRDNRTHTFVDILREEASALFVLPLLTIIGHCTIAKVFSGSERVDAAQEILVIGISNIISCFFSSMPIGGSFSRTTVNAQSGSKTPAGGLVTGIIVILALEYLTPYFLYIPKASLASVICVSCIFMVNPYIILPLWRSKKMDLIPWAVTFLMTLFTGLEKCIDIDGQDGDLFEGIKVGFTGILLSAMFLLFYSARPRVKVSTRQTQKENVFIHILLDRSLTFPSVDFITNKIIETAINWDNKQTAFVVDLHHVQYCDYTAAEGIRDLIVNMNNLGYKVFFWKVKPSVFRVISGIMVYSDVPFLRCNTEQELEAVVDGVQRRLAMFHILGWTLHFNRDYQTNGERKRSDTAPVAATSAVSTGVFF